MITYYLTYNGKKIKVDKWLIDQLSCYLIECTTLEEGLLKYERVFTIGLLDDSEYNDAIETIEDYLKNL